MAKAGQEPPSQSTDTERPQDPNCVFCQIIHGKTDTELLYSDDHYVCFRDIHPDAPHHYQLVPKAHLPNVKFLTAEHIPVIEKMAEIGREILQQYFKGDLSDTRIGYHWPPFSSVRHLHLHILAPVSQMSFLKKNIVFRENSMNFISTEWAINYLKGKL